MDKKNLILLGIGTVALSVISFAVGVVVTNNPVPKLENGKDLVAKIKGLELTAEEFYEAMKTKSGLDLVLNEVNSFIADEEVETTDEIIKYANGQIEYYKNSIATQGGNWTQQLYTWGFASEAEMREYFIGDKKISTVAENYFGNKITDKQIEEYYNEEIFGEITAKHILITPDSTSTSTTAEKAEAEAKALETAREVITKLKNGEKWADLVTEYSEDTGTKSKEGELSFTKTEVVEEFWDASLALENGKYTVTPVKSTYGYHIILKVSQEARPTLKDSTDTIKKALIAKEMSDTTAVSKAWIEVRKSYDLELFDATLEKLYKDTVLSN
jgi:foldase protein PrsA